MLQSLKDALTDVVDGWWQARTFRHLLEITAGTPHNAETGTAGVELSDEERLNALSAAENFVEQYVRRVSNEFAFSVGAIMYGWLSPRYRRELPGLLARI
ncbi:MAG: hypothetical protein HYT16_04185 [DPANN group archaeon]|nr:hypothetical protein [DPANN group archaeon]